MQHHDRCIQGHDHQIDSKPLRMARAISGTPYESSGPPVASGKLAVTLPVLSRSSGQVVQIALRCKTYLPAQQTQLQMLAKDILRSTVKLAYIVYFACCQLQISFGGLGLAVFDLHQNLRSSQHATNCAKRRIHIALRLFG